MTLPELADLAPWIEERFTRAGGPGGQHVNKTSTRVELLFDFEGCALLTPAQRELLRGRLRTRLSRDGRLRVTAQDERSQVGNREHAGRRLLELLRAALHRARARIATRPSRGSQKRRLTAKRERGEAKRRRTKPSGEE